MDQEHLANLSSNANNTTQELAMTGKNSYHRQQQPQFVQVMVEDCYSEEDNSDSCNDRD